MRLLVAIIGLTSFCIYFVSRGVVGTPSIYPVDATAATRRGCWAAAVALRAEVPLPGPSLRHNERYGAAFRVPSDRGNVLFPSYLGQPCPNLPRSAEIVPNPYAPELREGGRRCRLCSWMLLNPRCLWAGKGRWRTAVWRKAVEGKRVR